MSIPCSALRGFRHATGEGPWAGILVLACILAACPGCGGDADATDAGSDGDTQESDEDTQESDGDTRDEADEGEPQDDVAPRLYGALSESNTRVRLTFNELLADDADNRAHFVLDPPLRIEDAVFGTTNDILYLTTEPQTNLVRYTVQVIREDTNLDGVVDGDDAIVTDVAGNPIDPDFDTAEFIGISTMVYAIVDVLVADSAAAVPSDYTGVAFNACTEPFVPEETGTRVSGADVNTGIGGTTTTINVKYQFLPATSPELVVTGISAQHWPNWTSSCPDGWERANGTSSGMQGALTTGTEGDCWRIGLCMHRQPLNEARTTGFLSNAAFSWPGSPVACPATCNSNGADWPMTADALDIHSGCGDGRYLYICRNAATSDP